MNKEEYRRQLVEMFSNVLKEKGLEWRKEWANLTTPRNGISNKAYRGCNHIYLSLLAASKGYDDPRWVTMNQITDYKGLYHPNEKWHLKKGSKAAHVEYWFPVDCDSKKALTWEQYTTARLNGREEKEFMFCVKYIPVFNASLVEGMPPLIQQPKQEIVQDELINTLQKNMGVAIRNDGVDRAYYSPEEDEVHLPDPSTFTSEYAYNATTLHELAHSTGHPSRLGRDMSHPFGSEEYAYEELVAEMCSCFMGVELTAEATQRHIDNHKAYVQSWLKEITDKPDTLIRAIRDAQAATTYMEEKAGLRLHQENVEEVLTAAPPAVDTVSPKETMVVNFFSGPSAGKTTCAMIVTSELKKRGYTAEYVSEYAKDLVWENRLDLLDGTVKNQRMLLKEQMRREDRLMGKVDFIITDSPTLLNVTYLSRRNTKYEKEVAADFNAKNNFCLFLERGEEFETVGRVHDAVQSQKLDASIHNLLERNQISYTTYRHETVPQLIDDIEKAYRGELVEKAIPPAVDDNVVYGKKTEDSQKQKGFSNPTSRPPISAAVKEQLKELPILDVAESFGLHPQTKGKHATVAVRDEKTASCTFYPNNTFYDFGSGVGGDTIAFAQYVTGKEFYEACTELAQNFGIEISRKYQKGEAFLSDQQYALIGISADLATKNFDLDVARWGVERTKKFAEQYQMTVQELAKQHPDIYHNMLRSRAVPWVYEMRHGYYREILTTDALCRATGTDLTTQFPMLQDLQKVSLKLNSAEQVLKKAITDKSRLSFNAKRHDLQRDIQAIRDGRISIEVGNISYAEYKKQTNQHEETRLFHKIPYEEYVTFQSATADVPYAAFYRNGEVNIAYEMKYHERLFPNLSLAEVQRPEQAQSQQKKPISQVGSKRNPPPKKR